MITLHFASANTEKIQIAQAICAEYDIEVKAVELDIDEIQSEEPELIVRAKAQRAFDLLGSPVIVSDDTWNIHALNGFPGAYMKSVNQWFTPEDFLRLMHGITDRRVTLHQHLAYADGSTVRVFKKDIHGMIINEPRGIHEKSPNMTITTMDQDGGKTIAEVFELGNDAVVARSQGKREAWHDFADWYLELTT